MFVSSKRFFHNILTFTVHDGGDSYHSHRGPVPIAPRDEGNGSDVDVHLSVSDGTANVPPGWDLYV